MSPSRNHDYPDDMFEETRMTFGEHIEELRTRLIKAIKGLVFFLVIGFVLDGIGTALGLPWFGIGRPAVDFITDPVKSQVKEFYRNRYAEIYKRLQEERKNRGVPADLSELNVRVPVQAFLDTFEGLRVKDPSVTEVPVTLKVDPRELDLFGKGGELLNDSKQWLTTLSVQEGFVVYFKVSLLCGFILASPWIFYQLWAFVAAGLYPHEKRYVHVYLPFSIGLFLAGVAVCQFLVLPGAVRALLAFNEWIGLDPDLRLNEWLGFAIIMPLVFGISFQTPLVMLFLNRLGIFSADDYLSKWRFAVFFMACFSALITPTPDAVSMLYLFVPMFGLYLFGIFICKMMPPPAFAEEEEPEEEIAV